MPAISSSTAPSLFPVTPAGRSGPPARRVLPDPPGTDGDASAPGRIPTIGDGNVPVAPGRGGAFPVAGADGYTPPRRPFGGMFSSIGRFFRFLLTSGRS